jgi:hypothetical protein
VALHDQPQGGLAMRRVARGYDSDDTGFTRWRGGQYYDPRQSGQYYYQRRQRWWW